MGTQCAERGQLLGRVRRFYQTVAASEAEARKAAQAAREEVRLLRPVEDLAEERKAALAKSAEKIDTFRGELLRLKMIKSVHERRLNEAELTRKRDRPQGGSTSHTQQ